MPRKFIYFVVYVSDSDCFALYVAVQWESPHALLQFSAIYFHSGFYIIYPKTIHFLYGRPYDSEQWTIQQKQRKYILFSK